MRLDVNGETMQDASTAEMIFNVREQIAYLSSLLTLEPGDVIATGTPTGVSGWARRILEARRRHDGVDRRHRRSRESRSRRGGGLVRKPVGASMVRKRRKDAEPPRFSRRPSL